MVSADHKPVSAVSAVGALMRPIIVLVGPSGCGKTVVGQALAKAIHSVFLDADDFHTTEAKALMHSGHSLSDDERWPWLERVRSAAVKESCHSVVIVACSALKPELRHFLSQGSGTWRFVALEVDEATLRDRLMHRTGHFFPASLLDSQLLIWHPLAPEEGISVDGGQSVDAVVAEIIEKLHLGERG